MTSPHRFWSDLTTADFASLDLARTIAVLPVAAIEQHGPHLPLSVDTDIVNGVVQAALPHIPAPLPVLGLPRIVAAKLALDALPPEAFAGAEGRRIRHRAGFAELDQSGAEYLHLFGMPNFIFHTTMAFAVLRAQGIEIGKADFDGLHDYPHGFRF